MGGLKASGRWHHAGHAIVYLAQTPASALLEVCVHTNANDVPPAFTLLKIEGPALEVPSIPIGSLPKDWQTHPEVTRDLGTAGSKRSGASCYRCRAPLCLRRPTISSIHHTNKQRSSTSRTCSLIRSIFGSRRRRTWSISRPPEARTPYNPSTSAEASRRRAACRRLPGTAPPRRSQRAECIRGRSAHTPQAHPAIRWAALC